MFLGICSVISSSMANSVKFSAIFFLPSEAKLVPRASRRMRVEEQILFFDILSLSTTIRPFKIKESIKRKQRNSKHKQLVAK